MINPDVFAEWFGEMDDHFPGERSERLARVYYNYLSERMDTDAFERACIDVLASREFLPPMDVFAEAGDAGGQSVEARALEQQEIVQQEAKNWRQADLSRLDGPAQRAVDMLGGIKRISMTDTDDLPFRLREFRQHYADLADQGDTTEKLPPMTDEGRALIEGALAGEIEAEDAA